VKVEVAVIHEQRILVEEAVLESRPAAVYFFRFEQAVVEEVGGVNCFSA
jgi:hypothetical protein